GGGARRPCPGIAPPPTRRLTLLGHATAPCDPCWIRRLPEGEMCRKRNGCRKWRRTCTGCGLVLLPHLADQRRLGRDVMADDLPVAVFADDHPGDLHGQRRSIDDKMRGAGHVD